MGQSAAEFMLIYSHQDRRQRRVRWTDRNLQDFILDKVWSIFGNFTILLECFMEYLLFALSNVHSTLK